jgi:hypothetical protein
LHHPQGRRIAIPERLEQRKFDDHRKRRKTDSMKRGNLRDKKGGRPAERNEGYAEPIRQVRRTREN